MSNRIQRRFVIAAIALSVSACYSYVSTSTPPNLGERVRVSLTPEGTVELARYLGPRVAIAEGMLNASDDSTMVIGVDFVQLTDGMRQPWSGEGAVPFPTAYIADVRQRTFQRRRSIVAATALTGALVAVAVAALRLAGSGAGDCVGCGPPPP